MLNKLLVPTNPYYHPNDGDIVSGRNPDVGVASGIFGSFLMLQVMFFKTMVLIT